MEVYATAEVLGLLYLKREDAKYPITIEIVRCSDGYRLNLDSPVLEMFKKMPPYNSLRASFNATKSMIFAHTDFHLHGIHKRDIDAIEDKKIRERLEKYVYQDGHLKVITFDNINDLVCQPFLIRGVSLTWYTFFIYTIKI